MKDINGQKPSLSMAEWSGLLSLLTAVLLFFIDARLSPIPLAVFFLLCISAPFFPRFGFYLPIISRGISGKRAVAITFDDGPDSLTTPHLLQLLHEHRVKAAFFVTGKKAAENPELVNAILEQGHAIGNHSYSHNILILFKSCQGIIKEIEAAQNVLGEFGVRPLAFRPPAGITNPRLRPALLKCGVYLVNFSCRAFDGGNRWIENLSGRILKQVRPDDIILLHDSRPKYESTLPQWLNEIERLLSGLRSRGLAVLPLSEIIEKPVMIIGADGVTEKKMNR